MTLTVTGYGPKKSKEKLTKSILKIRAFYKSLLKKNVRIAILGLNPHCETTDKFCLLYTSPSPRDP